MDFEALRDDFLRFTTDIVYCTVTTVDPAGRPRSRVMHPIFEVVDGQPRGWALTDRTALKDRHLAANPHVACFYWSPAQNTVAIDCTAEWVDDDDVLRQVYDVFASPEPPGWGDLSGYGEAGIHHPQFHVLRLLPYRIQILRAEQLAAGDFTPRTWRRERAAAVPEVSLRLVWPQWQGAGTTSVQQFAAEFPFDVARRGYAVGSTVLQAVLPPHNGPSATVTVSMTDEGLAEKDGVEAKAVVVKQLAGALEIIGRHGPARIATLGGECSVSVAPFSALAERYGNDLAVIWIDSHPDVGTGDSEYPGYHAMAVSALTGHGDPDVQALLPATVAPDRVALVGLHSLDDDDYPNITDWGLRTFSPADLRESSHALLTWLADTGCRRAAIHFDVDTIDSNEIVLGLGPEPDGLTTAQVRRIVADIDHVVDVVGLTVAEFIPRQVMHLQGLVEGFPLLGGSSSTGDRLPGQ